MKLGIGMIVLFSVVGLNSFASTIECSSIKGSLKYYSTWYDAGIEPPRGTIIGKSTWTRGGYPIGETTYRYLARPTSWGVVGNLVEATKVVIDKSNANDLPVGSIKFKIRADLKYQTDPVVKSADMICTESYYTIPRP